MTSFDIKNQEFKKVFRGYDHDDVMSFLEHVAAEWENAQKHQSALSEKIIGLETQLKDFKAMEKALQQTFMQAQETSGKAIENARKEAQLILQEAEVKASQILEKARNDLTTVKEEVTILRVKKESIVSRLRILLNSELNLLKVMDADEELQSRIPRGAHEEQSKEKLEIEEIIKQLEQ
ncbi:MAG: DivIVA domain-containing protein [Ignavibacteria bacterium]|nr:DivIVA domain-containing protein [Ignavibacteria bacterium]